MTRIADELHAMLKYRAFNVTGWVARSAEVRAFDLQDHMRPRQMVNMVHSTCEKVKREGRGA